MGAYWTRHLKSFLKLKYSKYIVPALGILSTVLPAVLRMDTRDLSLLSFPFLGRFCLITNLFILSLFFHPPGLLFRFQLHCFPV